MNKVGIYLRISNEDNNEDESIKNQRNLLLDYINKNNLILEDIYCDRNLSGAGTYRPEFERLIKDCEKKKIDIVLCKSQSRFSRDMEVIEKYLHNKFIEWNIRFISLSDNADTTNIGNKKARQINGLINEWYLEDTSNNIRTAFLSKMKQGEFISPFAPYGYKINILDNNQLLVDEEVKENVQKIYNLYLKGYSYQKIADYLNKNNIPSPSLYKYQKGIKLNIVTNKKREDIMWNTSAIKTILTNEIYIGNLVQGKRTTVSYKNHKIIKKKKANWISYPNTHEAIINQDTFQKVQEEIKKRTKVKNPNKIIHNFSGLVYCDKCGSIMRKKNSAKHSYLVCSKYSLNKSCNNKTSIRYDYLEKIIIQNINKLIDKYYDAKLLENFDDTYKIRLETLKNKKNSLLLDTNNRFLEILYNDRLNDIITDKEFKELIEKVKKKQSKSKEMLKSINKQIKELKKIDNQKLSINSLNRFITSEFISRITIGEQIIITWNF